jgi:hypothetical protein
MYSNLIKTTPTQQFSATMKWELGHDHDVEIIGANTAFMQQL